MSNIETKEVNQIAVDLYKYIASFNLELPVDYEFFREKGPCISFKQSSTSVQKLNSYLAGDYDAEFHFIIYHRNKVQDRKKKFDITKPFYQLEKAFIEETENNFPNFKFKDEKFVPVSLEMVSTPEDGTGIENNTATYLAVYRLVYHKKGRFE